MKKRGMSEIIAVVLIVLLTFAAAGMIVAFVVPFVKNNLNEGTECFNYREYFLFEGSLNCYINGQPGQEGKDYYISVKAKTTKKEVEEKIEGFKILFKTNENVKVFDVKNGVNEGEFAMLNPNEDTLSVPSGGESRSYRYTDTGSTGEIIYSEAEIYPILKENKLCEKSDAVEIELCSQEIINIINAP